MCNVNGLPFSEYLSTYSSEIILRTQQHALLSFYCIAAATVLGLLVAVPAYRSPLAAELQHRHRGGLLHAPLGRAVRLPRLGRRLRPVSVFPVVVGYAMLPIIRNGIVGLQSADPAVLDAARGMGVGSFRMLWQVRMPIAWPVLLAGIRVSAQLTVGVVAIAAFVVKLGLGQYGYSALDNLGSVNTKNQALVCVLFVILVALLFDAVFVVVRRFTTPRGSRA